MKHQPIHTGIQLILRISGMIFILLGSLYLAGCSPDSYESGTLEVTVTGAEDHNGKNFFYTAETWLPDRARSLDDEKVISGYELIADGGVSFIVEDPETPGMDYLFLGNNVVSFYGFIDVDDSGSEEGGIDWTLNEMLDRSRSVNINGDLGIEAVYPDDFHISESGSPGFWIAFGSGGFAYGNEVNLGSVPGGTSKAFSFSLQNSGTALLSLTGTSPVSFSGTDSSFFTVTAQPADTDIIPDDTEPFTVTVNAPAGSGTTYSATLTITFDDTLFYDPEGESPFIATLAFTN